MRSSAARRRAGGGPAPLVTVHLWTVPPRAVPASLHAMGARAWHRTTVGLRFAKMAGTAGPRFTPAGTRLDRWLAVCVWADPRCADLFDQTDYARHWSERAASTVRLDLRPIAARGRWSGVEPFGSLPPPGPDGPQPDTVTRPPGPVAALTRARLVPRHQPRFWRHIPRVGADLDALEAANRPLLRLGFSECPGVMQGTFSLWPNASALTGFAYGTPAHRQAITDTRRVGWYAEELFARFEVLATRGSLEPAVRADS